MFCPSCGVAVVSGLRFCNHCGARIAVEEPQQISPAMLISAMAFVFVFGLVAISVFTVILNESIHLSPGQSMGFAGLGLLILAVLEAVFITLLFRGKRQTKEPKQTGQLPFRKEELRAFPDKGENTPSVTEHTTRAFDYIPKQPSKDLN